MIEIKPFSILLQIIYKVSLWCNFFQFYLILAGRHILGNIICKLRYIGWICFQNIRKMAVKLSRSVSWRGFNTLGVVGHPRMVADMIKFYSVPWTYLKTRPNKVLTVTWHLGRRVFGFNLRWCESHSLEVKKSYLTLSVENDCPLTSDSFFSIKNGSGSLIFPLIHYEFWYSQWFCVILKVQGQLSPTEATSESLTIRINVVIKISF